MFVRKKKKNRRKKLIAADTVHHPHMRPPVGSKSTEQQSLNDGVIKKKLLHRGGVRVVARYGVVVRAEYNSCFWQFLHHYWSDCLHIKNTQSSLSNTTTILWKTSYLQGCKIYEWSSDRWWSRTMTSIRFLAVISRRMLLTSGSWLPFGVAVTRRGFLVITAKAWRFELAESWEADLLRDLLTILASVHSSAEWPHPQVVKQRQQLS